MNPAQLSLLAFVAVAATIIGLGLLIYDLFFKYRDQVDKRLDEDFRRGPVSSRGQTKLFKDLSKFAEQSEDQIEDPRDSLLRAIEQAGLDVRPSQVILACLAVATTTGSAAALLTGTWWVATTGFVLTLPLPLLTVMLQRDRRLAKLRSQLPDAFEMMSRSISAGQTVNRAFQTVAEDFESPISDEFAWCAEQQKLGLSQDLALRDLARRAGVPELQMLVVALLVQRQSGGSPVELLDNLASMVRQRIEMQERIKSLTAEGRVQAAVLLLMPPLLLAVIAALNPEYVSVLWDRPRLLAAMAGSELMGIVWIRRILALEF